MEDGDVPLYLALLFILVLLSAIFSASETAFFSLNTLRIERLATEGNKRAKRIQSLLKSPSNLIATILIGNEMANIAIASVSAVLFTNLLGREGSVLSVPITTIVLLIFGEVTPKVLAIRYNEAYAFFVAKFIELLSILILPLRMLLVFIASTILKPFGVTPFSKAKALTDEEFMILVAEGERGGSICNEEKQLIGRTLELGDMDVKEIMIPKHRIFALNQDETVGEAIEKISKTKFSRVPIYGNSLDDIKGILYTKTLLPFKLKGINLEKPVKNFMNKPYFVTEFLTLDKLLEQMQRTKNHMAIVVDEYGNTAGIITLDDILSEIVGRLPDEKIEEEKDFERIGKNKIRISGDANVDDLKDLLELNENPLLDEVDTAAGLLMAILGKIPSKNESTIWQGYRFTVERKEGNRILSIIAQRIT